jgi:hypothetical protein
MLLFVRCAMVVTAVLGSGHTPTTHKTASEPRVAITSPASAPVAGAGTVMTTTAATATTTTTAFAGCGGVDRCIANPHCAQCLLAVNATRNFPHTLAEFNRLGRAATRAYEVGFFQTLQSTASCSTSVTPPGIIYAALQELADVISCDDEHAMYSSTCLVAEYACFVEPHCRQCLDRLHAASADDGHNGTKAAVLQSLACTATSPALFSDLTNNCGGGSFPTCTLYKHQCARLTECASCLAMLVAGNGAVAAQKCPGGSTQPSALALDHAVVYCIDSNAVACDFWRQRCANNVDCDSCLVGMGNGDNARAIAADWSTAACQRAAHDHLTAFYLTAIAHGCPGISACREAITHCVLSKGDSCITCLNGSAPHTQAAYCTRLLQEWFLDTACQPCSATVHAINAIVLATAVVGGASAAVCLAVATTIVAHGRDRVSMRDRIVVGLMLTNTVYSTANAIPLNALRSGVVDCGRLAMSFDAIRVGRAWWFCGKYGLVGFELLILGSSIRAMYRSMSAVPWRAEVAMHAACCAVAVTAFAVFYNLCARINADGYDLSRENEAYTNAYNHASVNDDLDDDEPSASASLTYQSARDAYDNLVRDMLLVWDGVVVVAVGLWIVLRLLHRHALQALRSVAAGTAHAEANDEWAGTRRSAWKARQRFLEARREAFNEVAKPLEPYIFVFVLFAAPAFVMSTTFCQSHSGASEVGGESTAGNVGGASTDFTYGTCDVWCEFVLAFRSLVSVAVYLAPRERREDLVAVRSTWSKLCARVVGCVRCPLSQYAPTGLDLGRGAIQMDALEQQQQQRANNNNSAVGDVDASATAAAAATLADVSSWRINECDVIMVKRLGQGAFGGVWEARLRPDGRRVAVKCFFAGGVDEDGDPINPRAADEFGLECEALLRVDSPHLIKFFGSGTTSEGRGFIVTELMSGGSLEGALHDPKRDLPWRVRVMIGLQVALGMEHLHKRLMLHRDLKSANVLLDENLKAKVCDFGLVRVVRPVRRQKLVQSPFTGVKRLVPHVDGIEINDGLSDLSMARIGVSVMDARGTMTTAAGTELWMAPEVFRGDQNYTGAVDVYSFGIVMWELATRKTPWVHELLSDRALFFQSLNHALQTGRRPAIPDAVLADHAAFVATMQRCWAGDPVDRPTVSEVVTELAECLRACW